MPDRRESGEFHNPAPPRHVSMDMDDEDDKHKLTNDDFRKLLMTPKAPSAGSSSHSQSQPSTTSRESSSTASGTRPRVHVKLHEEDFLDEDDDGDESSASRRRRKKLYYAKLMKQREEREKELNAKYRDRARERRDGNNADYEQTEQIEISTTADYKAVAPDAKIGEDYAERRKKVIQESKYLGGDMEHTHLVKGLDYALLEKVRAEINSKEVGDDDLEKAVAQTEADKEEEDEQVEQQMNFKTKQGRNIYRQIFRNRLPHRNDLFLPGRMAYVIDLEDEYADTDVPTTVIRSKADCPTLEASTTLSTNDMVINKLTQILTYLRHGRRDLKKLRKKDKLKDDKSRPKVPAMEESIYDDLGDYDLSRPKAKPKERGSTVKEERGRDRRDKGRSDRYPDDKGRSERYPEDRERSDRYADDRSDRYAEDKKRRSYFEKPEEEDESKDKDTSQSANEFVKSINDRFKSFADPATTERVNKQEEERVKKLKAKTEIDSYAECYPGMMESADAIGDSDDEADFTKMDQGTKKGPVGRWDFDTHEEYGHYMSRKEALPKAAFQYGVKMSDGRKTRRGGPKDEKAELDREWQKIQKLIEKRKGPEPGDGSHKKAKY